MQNVSISLPDFLKRFVDMQIVQGHHGSVSEYVCELIRADEQRNVKKQPYSLMPEGLRGDEAVFMRVDWQSIRHESLIRMREARKNRS